MARASTSRRLFRAVLLLLIVLAGGAIALGVIWSLPYSGVPAAEKFVAIPRGTSSYATARLLEREGVVRHWALFLAYLKLAKPKSPLQAGEYRFAEPLSTIQVAEKLIRGFVYYHEFTVPEGYSLFEIGPLLEQKGFGRAADVQTAAGQVKLIADLSPKAKNLEGFLFPDTYRLARGTTTEEITQLMVRRFHEVYATLQTQQRQLFLSPQQVVTLASLIEKETSIDTERELISAVFQNRLKKGMLLQCDPTVIYAAQLKGNYRGKIFQSDLESDSPYNTYRHLGLPPGPIANPGKRSLEAALTPAQTDYLYFVADNQGGHVFSKTLEEHQRAVAAYRKGLTEIEKTRAAAASGVGKL
jgi:peptidoglycan lytic transglycosylase G